MIDQDKVDEFILKRDPNRCWPWRGSINPSGYGQFNFGKQTIGAHRYAYWREHDHAPEVVMHMCDNRLCVNPKHLRAGTSKENNLETVYKGRHKPQRGEQHHNAKLDREDVIEIRAMFVAGRRKAFIAEFFGISETHVQKIVMGDAWSHV